MALLFPKQWWLRPSPSRQSFTFTCVLLLAPNVCPLTLPYSRCMWVPSSRMKGGVRITLRVQCYFVLNASPASPIYYNVDRVREGRSYVTRAVRAVQAGRAIFIMLCSYQKPEPWQPSYRSPMPPNIPSPEECKDEAIIYRERAAAANHEYLKNMWTTGAEVSPPHFISFSANITIAVSGQEPNSHTVRRGPLRRRCARLLCMDEGKAGPRVRPRLPEGLNLVRVVVYVPFAHNFP